MRRCISGAWMVWTAVAIAGCTGGNSSTDNVPWSHLDMTQRPDQKVGGQHPGGGNNGGGQAGDGVSNISGARPWRYIVIHHSANPDGNATTIGAAHKARGWDELGYHFVIDNGNGGPNGRLEVGPRWKAQKWGAHTGNTPDNEYNKFGIGICLVGNYQNHLPSKAQLAELERLVRSLAARYGISPRDVISHRDAPGAKTECPGDALHAWIYGTLRPSLGRQMAHK